jgi:hypothetical protein
MWRQLFPAARGHLNFAALTSLAASVSDRPLNPRPLPALAGPGCNHVQRSAATGVGDGEKWGETPVIITVLPGAIGVITPAETP